MRYLTWFKLNQRLEIWWLCHWHCNTCMLMTQTVLLSALSLWSVFTQGIMNYIHLIIFLIIFSLLILLHVFFFFHYAISHVSFFYSAFLPAWIFWTHTLWFIILQLHCQLSTFWKGWGGGLIGKWVSMFLYIHRSMVAYIRDGEEGEGEKSEWLIGTLWPTKDQRGHGQPPEQQLC